ncbi:F-box domain containing protein isoform X1 [Zea mays]|uniref:F-box domain containing protein isoform X1 n=1 Tax=Zea mays TaxID=4577 RepID=UPI001652F715|nr:F-box domain containing protein isoform X1 [Zea mays]
MAPPKGDDPMSQILARIEEGNRETHRRMEEMKVSMSGMETTVRSVLMEQGEFQKWHPEVEHKVSQIGEALAAIQAKVDQFVPPTAREHHQADGASGAAHLGFSSTEAMHGQTGHRKDEPYRRPGARTDEVRTPPPVKGTVPSNTPHQFRWESEGRQSMGEWSQGSGLGSVGPSMNFPLFDGSNPKLWKHRSETYFEFYLVPRERWIRMSIMYFEGPAVFWVQSMEDKIREMNWEEFCTHLVTRFGRDQHNLLIRQFYHIKQITSVVDYVEQFDILMHQLLAHENQLTSSMITARFIDGLKDEIKSVILIQRPSDLDTACSLALLQEDVLICTGSKESRRMEGGGFSKPTGRFSPVPGSNSNVNGGRNAQSTNDRRGGTTMNPRTDDGKLSALKAYRRAKGLCFKCGERWGQSHRCSANVPLHVVEEMWAMAQATEESDGNEELENTYENEEDAEILAISAAAVSGGEGNRTIRLLASVCGQQVLILVDSGSSGSFMSNKLMGTISPVQKLPRPIRVKVADGRILWSKHWVPNCKWLCGGITFHMDLKVLPLSGYDMILGMDWLEGYSPMAVHWAEKWMKFLHNGKEVLLQGLKPQLGSCRQLSSTQLRGLVKRDVVEQLLEIRVATQTDNSGIPPVIEQLVGRYQDLFQKPKALPPKKVHRSLYPSNTGCTSISVEALSVYPTAKV